MNFSKSIQRNKIELEHFSSQTNCCQKNRNSRDPFEGDPFKVQSLNFRYADNPAFYPVSNRGKGQVEADKSQVKQIFYNHDHTISKCDKENLPDGYPKQMSQCLYPRKSPSVRSLSLAAKLYGIEKSTSSTFPVAQRIKATSQDLAPCAKKTTFSKGLDPSKSFIDQMSASISPSNPNSNIMLKKRPLKLKNTLPKNDLMDSNTDINLDNGDCLITIKINGIPKNQVHIKNNDSIEITLPRMKKVKRSKTLIMSPHALKPSRSYIINKNDTNSNVDQVVDPNTSTNQTLVGNLNKNSTQSIAPHKERNSVVSDNMKAYSTLRLNKHLERHATTLEKILSNNPIVIPPKEKLLFSRSKTILGKRSSSSATLASNLFEKSN